MSKRKTVVELWSDGVITRFRTLSNANPEALYVACKQGDLDKARRLVSYGSDVNWTNQNEVSSDRSL